MKQHRTIARVFRAHETREGAGVKLKRCFTYFDTELFDPFLLFDDFSSKRKEDHLPGFPFHPHRGMETVTYLLQGSITHRDSLGNEGVLTKGDVQWMTAGSGIIHEEMPGNEEVLVGFQLWLNLPMSDKMCAPQYQEIRNAHIPTVVHGDAIVRVIAGTYGEVTGPIKDIKVQPLYLDITLKEHTALEVSLTEEHTAFLYVIEGEPLIGMHESKVCANTVVLFEHTGNTVRLRTIEKSAHVLLVAGEPLNEPVAWHGPIVMNTHEELRSAFTELSEGTFIKHSHQDQSSQNTSMH